MIYKLRKKFILISVVSVLAVILTVFSLMTILNTVSMNRNLDILADNILRGGGEFPDSFGDRNPNIDRPEQPPNEFITPETRFSTRYFTLWFNNDGENTGINTKSIYAITDETALQYAKQALESGKEQGWISSYRYKVFNGQNEKMVVFVDGTQNLSSFWQSITISAAVLIGCAGLVLLMIFILSKKVVKPFADNYEKQKQFVTDANHELKTPLTLILANIDIAETELGQNEWLNDAKEEGQKMTELINQLVALSRADEDSQKTELVTLAFSDIVKDIVSDFNAIAESKNKMLVSNIDSEITYNGDEMLIRRLISILMDNAIKYCDENGEIKVTLNKKRNIVLSVENTYGDVDGVELEKLFDRFYRADKARTYAGGFGIGLSIAKAIVEKHRGEISAYKKENRIIGFKVVL